jgi:hypothetical protein
MSPEVMKGKTAGPGADIFALGIITYEMLTGENPFKSKSLPELAGKLANLTPPPVTDLVPSLAGEWNPFIEKCLEKDLNDRFSSAEEMRPQLKELALVISGKKASSYKYDKKKSVSRTSTDSPSKADESTNEDKTGRRSQRHKGSSGNQSGSLKRGSTPNEKSGINHHITNSSAAHSLQPEKRSRTILRATIPMLFILILFSILVLTRMGGPAPAANATEITHTPIPGGVTVKWKSDLPYISQIKLLKPEQQLVSGNTSGDVTVHEVHVTGFASNEAIEYVVVYPTGETSLPNSVRAGGKIVTIDSVKLEEQGFRLRWKNPLPGCDVFCAIKGRELNAFRELEKTLPPVKVVTEDSDFCTATIPVPVELISDIEIILSSKSMGTFNLSIAQSLIPQIKVLSEHLNLIPPDKIVVEARDLVAHTLQKETEEIRKMKKVDSLSTNELDRLRSELRTKQLHNILNDRGLLKAYDDVSRISLLAFGLGDIPFAQKKQLYKGCVSILKLVVFSGCAGQRNRIILPSIPYMSGFNRSTQAHPGSNDTIKVYSSEEPKGFNLETTPVSLTHRTFQELKFSFKLDYRQVTNLVWAELAIMQSSFSHMVIRILVNGNEELVLYDTPLVKHVDSRRIINYQRIPPLYLKEGINNIEFQTVQLFGDVGERYTMIPSITLRMNTQQ